MIEVGQILDKYELLEKVGQGGMAVVYRGLDRSLKRQVAIKVLHRHLSEHQEARDRFEREAHAVAKLHHENILEIFDFSGTSAEESYIVTEFIDGQTLKEFTTTHDIKFPEVGAMVCVQVCRALGHAHGLGILHRDVKPENIMIRSDGVVKLMDFGIAQMIDLQRMTVTGQLLGSPAYMSPEHVEGQPLDFRTDVFSVGILLYQLVIGRLPFRGRNPHEILKRIAECEYEDPRKANPRVGKELGGIIRRALAREPDDRYPDISEMLRALERYCEGSGLTDHGKELALFFESPAAYEMALERRLLDTLTRRGRELLETDRIAALELFNRVLTIDPHNAEVLAEIDRMSRRKRGARLALLFGGVVVLGAGAYGVRGWVTGDGERAAVISADAAPELAIDAGPQLVFDAMTRVVAAPPDAAPEIVSIDAAPARHIRRHARHPIRIKPRRKPDAGVSMPPRPVERVLRLRVSPFNSEYKLAGGPWTRIAGSQVAVKVPAGVSSVQVRNDLCCQAEIVSFSSEGPIQPKVVNLTFLPAAVTPECDKPVLVRIDGQSATLGKPAYIPINSLSARRRVKVEFIRRDNPSESSVQHLRVRYKENKTVTCPW